MAIKSQQLRQSFLISGAGAAVLLVVFVAWLTSSRVGQVLEQQADVRGRDVGMRVSAIVTQYLKERHREVASLASMPQVIAVVRRASADVVVRGLDRLAIATLEARFDASRQLGGDPVLGDYLRAYTVLSDFSELSVSESHGLNVLVSRESPDFVQRDEVWWQRSMEDGSYEGEPQSDTTGTETALEFDVAIMAPHQARPVGVLRALFSLERLSKLLGSEELAGRAYLQVVAADKTVLVSRDATVLLQPLPDKDRIPFDAQPAAAHITTTSGDRELVVGAGEPGRMVGAVPGARDDGVCGGAYDAAHDLGRCVSRGGCGDRRDVLARAAARTSGDGAGTGCRRDRQPDRRRRSLGDRVDPPGRSDRSGCAALVGPLDGGGVAPAGRGDSRRRRRVGGDGHGDLGLDGGDERVYRRNGLDIAGSVAPRR